MKTLLIKTGYLWTVLLLITTISCSSDDVEPVAADEAAGEDMVQFRVEIRSDFSSPVSGVYVYDAETGTDRPPLSTYKSGSENEITGNFAKGAPVILRIHTAGYAPLYLFISSYFEEELSLAVQPEALALSETPEPAVIGNFNRFDEFRAVEMEPGGERWTARIDTELDTLRYLIIGVSYIAVPDLSANLVAADDHTRHQPGIESVAVREGNEPFYIEFDPSNRPVFPDEPVVWFDENTPARTAGTALVYLEMYRQEKFLQEVTERQEPVTEAHFERFFQRLDSLKVRYDVEEVRQAAHIAQSRFSEVLQPEEEWADSVLDDIAPGSDLWLMHHQAVGDLFSHSTRLESVSRDLWDIYRQNPASIIRGEALYNLLKFH